MLAMDFGAADILSFAGRHRHHCDGAVAGRERESDSIAAAAAIIIMLEMTSKKWNDT